MFILIFKILFGSFLSYKFSVTFVLLTIDINLNILLKGVAFSFLLFFSNNENNSVNIYFLLIISEEAISIIFVKVSKEFTAIVGLSLFI